MTQCRLLLTLWLASMLLATPASANEQYNQGSEFAKGIKGQEQAAIGGFDPAGRCPATPAHRLSQAITGRHQRLHRPHLTR